MNTIKRLFTFAMAVAMLATACISIVPTTALASPLSSESGYANVALNKSYVVSDITNSDGSISYRDENGKTMTDGAIPSNTAGYSNAAYMAFCGNDDLTRNGYGSITVDLGSLYKLDKFVAHVATSYGGNGSAGVYAPQLMWIYVSTDNKNWYKAGKVVPVEDNSKATMAMTVVLDSAVTARYVQYRLVDSKMWKRWIFVSEVQAYGIKTDTAIPYPEVDALDFLFIGNSSTYYFHNPVKFELICESVGINVNLTYCTIGSSYMSNFADPSHARCGAPLRTKLAEKKYDYIVIHDNSNADYDESQPAMETLMPLFKENGAEVVLYKRYSSSSSVSQRIASAYKHHRNYERLASTYDIEKVAPVADAFLLTANKYPEISMHHTDNSHHNNTSSYLIALVWAKTILGIDLSEVTYISDLTEATANKLKDIANIACDEGYPFDQLCYTTGGVQYRNVAAHKDYTVNGNAYSGNAFWSDVTNGNTKGKLTDTALATYGNDHAIGAYVGKSVDVTVDLGAVYDITAFKTDLYGNSGWGIAYPSENTVTYAISNDGLNFTPVGNGTMTETLSDAEWKAADFVLAPSSAVSARYVRATYTNNNGNTNTHFWMSELSVFGTKSANQPEPPVVVTDNLAYGKSYVTSGIHIQDDGTMPYPDENSKTMTDNFKAAEDATYSEPAFTGFNANTAEYKNNGYASISVDLGDVYAVDKFVTNIGTKKLSSGIVAPGNIEVYVSTDNSNWKKAGAIVPVDDENSGAIDVTIQLNASVSARYVQFRYTAAADHNWVFVSEVEVYEGDPVVEPEYVVGDVNGDTKVDSTDYLLVKRSCFDSYTLSEEEFTRANVDNNSDVNSTDYVLIKRIAFGTYTA